MPNRVKLEDLLDVLETVLADGGEISFTPHGNSMRPMLISGRDEITLKKPQGTLKKYDLPLYRRANGHFVLHRIIGKNKDGYIMRGDNQLYKEYGIKDENIVGVVVAFVRDGKQYKVTDFSYKLYCLARCNFVTILLRKIKNKIVRIIKKSKA